MCKKLMALGVPYLAFSFATWLLKKLFADWTNTDAGGLFHTLLLQPEAPYWYLYTLFFLFLITPTFVDKKTACVGFVASFIAKLLSLRGGVECYAISSVLSNGIWFVAGMCLYVSRVFPPHTNQKKWITAGAGMGAIFLFASAVIYRRGLETGGLSFGVGAMACAAVILLVSGASAAEVRGIRYLKQGIAGLARYTMPVFLMHTLFAAPLRAALLKIGIRNSFVQVVAGIMISFVGPIAAAKIMHRMKWPEFFLYPGKFVRLK